MSEDINVGLLSEALNEKVDRDWHNLIIPNDMGTKLNISGVRTVIESYKNGTDWYRLWSDGWIEQGGIPTVTTSLNLSFVKEFKYSPNVLVSTYNQPTNSTSDANYITMALNITTSNFTIRYYDSDSTGGRTGSICWYACGY